VFDDEAVEDLFNDVTVVVAEAVYGLKAHAEVFLLGPALGLVEEL
jgi:hypothetical protein